MPHGNHKPKLYNKYPKIERKKPNSKKEKKKGGEVCGCFKYKKYILHGYNDCNLNSS